MATRATTDGTSGICTLLAAIALGWAVPANALDYTSPSGDVSLQLPEGWAVMAPDAVRALESTLVTADGSVARVDVGFQPAGRSPFAEPVVLLTHVPGAPVSVGELFDAVADSRGLSPVVIGSIPGSRVAYGAPTLDRSRTAVRWEIDVRHPAEHVSRSLIAMFPGRGGITYLVLRTSPERASVDNAIFEAAAKSFRYGERAAPAAWQRRGRAFALRVFGIRIGGVLAIVLISTAGGLVAIMAACGLAKLLSRRDAEPEGS